jgi:hypothetical protein
MNWIQRLYANHIQKIMGYLIAGVGVLEYIDSSTINLVATALGPTYGPIVARGIQISAGLMVAYRASTVKKPPPP